MYFKYVVTEIVFSHKEKYRNGSVILLREILEVAERDNCCESHFVCSYCTTKGR